MMLISLMTKHFIPIEFPSYCVNKKDYTFIPCPGDKGFEENSSEKEKENKKSNDENKSQA